MLPVVPFIFLLTARTCVNLVKRYSRFSFFWLRLYMIVELAIFAYRANFHDKFYDALPYCSRDLVVPVWHSVQTWSHAGVRYPVELHLFTVPLCLHLPHHRSVGQPRLRQVPFDELCCQQELDVAVDQEGLGQLHRLACQEVRLLRSHLWRLQLVCYPRHL